MVHKPNHRKATEVGQFWVRSLNMTLRQFELVYQGLAECEAGTVCFVLYFHRYREEQLRRK
jgi:hypothetical protein